MTMTTDEAYGVISSFVEERSGIILGPDKFYLLAGRLQPVLRIFGVADLGSLAAQLRTTPAGNVATAVVEAMTTNESSFFRDVHPFDTLRDVIIPELLVRNAATRTLSIWSAACSTGQELYSIAMLLTAEFPQLTDWELTLHGSDLSTEVVNRASSGRFSKSEVARGLPDGMRNRFMRPVGPDFEVAGEIKDRCTFVQRNLHDDWPVRPLYDVVFCRYVLIYFDIEARAAIFTKLTRHMTPGGYLMLGGAETTVGVDNAWRCERVGPTTLYRNIRTPS